MRLQSMCFDVRFLLTGNNQIGLYRFIYWRYARWDRRNLGHTSVLTWFEQVTGGQLPQSKTGYKKRECSPTPAHVQTPLCRSNKSTQTMSRSSTCPDKVQCIK